jgi:predicted DNA-binding transcriptional regulator AlpA
MANKTKTHHPPSGSAWLDTRQVLEHFGGSRASLERRLADGSFPRPARLGGRRLWSAAEIQQFEQRLLADRGQP